MSLLKCPKCGEMFSDSYKSCPFCAEDEEYFSNEPKTRRSGGGLRLDRKNRQPKILGPAMIVVLILLAAVLVYAFFGEQIMDAIRGGEPEQPVVVDDPVDGEKTALELNPTAMQLTVGEIRALTASGAESFLWSSSDENVVTVSEDGVVTAQAVGTATVTVTDAAGEKSAQCAVTVEEAAVTPEPGPGTDPEPDPPVVTGNLTLKTIFGPVSSYEGKYDLTIKMRESFALTVEGASGQVVWSSSKTSVVTVDSDGTLHPVAPGTAEVTATVGGQSVVCIVRVSW